MRISDQIANMILKLLEDSGEGMTEIQRNELASVIGCAPSQINYVLGSRFTPEQGYMIESRRGGGGYIRITRVMLNKNAALMHLINSVGDHLDTGAARIIISNLLGGGAISLRDAQLLEAALSDKAYRNIRPDSRDELRASVFKQMLLCMID
ncbi:MAG TPA: CtsR family transcriptional regulator [Ruminococcaceae bacterium]|nr:CtsR family transcriptional regulator [Oscillospiraceae bacterium]